MMFTFMLDEWFSFAALNNIFSKKSLRIITIYQMIVNKWFDKYQIFAKFDYWWAEQLTSIVVRNLLIEI